MLDLSVLGSEVCTSYAHLDCNKTEKSKTFYLFSKLIRLETILIDEGVL